jgi:hypothetical protein
VFIARARAHKLTTRVLSEHPAPDLVEKIERPQVRGYEELGE